MIGKLLGHTQVQTTARYAHLARDSIQTAAARITGALGETCWPNQRHASTIRWTETRRFRGNVVIRRAPLTPKVVVTSMG